MLHRLATGVSFVDLQFQGHARIIATAVLDGPSGVALVDPGPSSTLPTLRRVFEAAGRPLDEVTAIVLTHIHLDHAGSVGSLVGQIPNVRVYVHELGAPHLVDPSKLLASAERLYTDRMASLWGAVEPVPSGAIVALAGGEHIEVGGRRLDVAYTPGHASHHVSYLSADTGVAFVGDTAGIKRGPAGYELPPTPPPDIDLESWRESLTRLERWRPETLFLTHFGPASPAGSHLSAFRDRLEWAATLVRRLLDDPGTDEEREVRFAQQLRQELRSRLGEAEAAEYEVAGRFDLSYRGLARYWKKKDAR